MATNRASVEGEITEGLYLARRDTRWDPYPSEELPVLVHVERRAGFAIIRCARHGFVYPVPMILIGQAHGAVARRNEP